MRILCPVLGAALGWLALTPCTLAGEKQLPASVQEVLKKADQVELLSLDPDPKQGADGDFHNWKVLGRTTVKDREAREKVVAAVVKGVKENTGGAAKCFEPRHGLVATHQGKRVELVICFACSQIHVYENGKRLPTVLTNESASPTLNEVLKKAGVPLPTK
jgi:hypothetical protein